ncbi:helix-turn-helix transcriptional regulator [Pseudonocardia endophytica]|uniref:Regulatory LuxR family protein n=1 Tax=Pseudonocardia endophytica TaxID=401976 RepID=A0A4R1HT67_PSEEN|nr:LuxR family transcriptional regulator [Pseudonocardia endophytica]TCK24493.1 regulatory LuxR family protein [Pseudonocardia endophytica]
MLHDREPALRRLRALAAGAAGGRGGAILVSGPLGSGRSALADAAAGIASAAGLTVLRAGADPVERDFAYGVAHQLLDPLLATADRPDSDRWLTGWGGEPPPPLGAVPVDPVDPGDAHARVRDLQELVETVAAERPLAVLVDDLQWADEPSVRWLAHLAVRAPDRPVALVVTAVDGDPGTARPPFRQLAGAAEELRTRALGPDAVRAVVAETFGQPGEPEFAAACRDVTGGSPAILHAVLGELRAAGARPVAARVADVRDTWPAAVRDRFLQSLRGQDGPAARYLRAVAVLGPGTDHEALRRLADLDPRELRTVPAVLATQGLLRADDPTRTAHPLVDDVAVDPAHREELHLRAAALLHELGRPVGEVAPHLMAVAAPLGGWAVEVLRSAAGEMVTAESGGPGGQAGGETSVRLLRRALLDSDVTGHERGVLLVELAAAERTTEPTTALRHVSQALPLLATDRDRSWALTLVDPALARDAPTAVRDAIRHADAAPAAGPPGPDLSDEGDRATGLRIRARARRMQEHSPSGLAASCELLRAALDVPETLMDTSAGRELAGVLVHAAALSGKVPARDVARLGDRLLRITPAWELRPARGVPSGDGPRSLLVLAMVAAGRPEPLETWLEPPRDAPGPSSSPDELALVRLAQGRTAAARALPGTVLRDPEGPPATALQAAIVAAAIGTRAMTPGRYVDDRPPGGGLVAHTIHQMTRGAAAVLAGECDLALECFLDCGRHLDHLGWTNPALFPWRSWAARLLRRRGERAAAIAHAEEDLALAELWGAAPALGRALRVRGTLVGGAGGGEQMRAAIEVLGDVADPGELGRAEIALGRHLNGMGDPAGEDLLRRGGRRVAEAGGTGAGTFDPAPASAAGELAERSRTERVPVAARRPGPSSSGPPSAFPGTVEPPAGPVPGAPSSDVPDIPDDPLTDAERQVVERVVAGATNQMIAEELGVSRRAVEKRLTSAYRKLGVSGRGALTGTG